MSIFLGWWAIPAAVTIGIWAWAVLQPLPKSHGDFDFGGAFTAIFRGVTCTFVTLIAWLIYFAARVAIGA